MPLLQHTIPSHTRQQWLLLFLVAMPFTPPAAVQDVPFGPPTDIAEGAVSGVTSMDAGDIDGDRRADVVVIEGGKGAGGRTAFFWFKAPAKPQGRWQRFAIDPDAPLRPFLGAAKLADMDGDGDLDLVVSSDNHSGSHRAADVFVFINPRPDGRAEDTWRSHRVNDATLPLHHINDMEIADMDGDGTPDVVVRSLEPNQIHLFFQDDITAYTHTSIDTHIDASEGLAVGRIDDDDLPDITYTGHWLQSPAAPRTQAYTRRPIDAAYEHVNQNTKEALGDLDGDGLLDVVLAPAESHRNGKPHDLAWYKNPGGNYEAEWPKSVIQADVNDHHTVKLGDMDGDGDLDVVVGVPWGSKRIQIYVNEGRGAFGAPQTVHSGHGLYSGVLADLDGDGDLDIAGQDTYSRASRPWTYENRRRVQTGVSVERTGDELPAAFGLEQNYPNPFHRTTTIRFAVAKARPVRLAVYDLMGREVAALAGGTYPAGRYAVIWDATGVVSGTYVYRLQAGTYAEARSLLVLK